MKKLYQAVLTVLCFTLMSFSAFAQKNYFSKTGETGISLQNAKRVIVPQKYEVLKLNGQELKTFLWSLPKESVAFQNRNSTPVLALPMPDGSIATFHVWQSSIQEPGLEAKFPDIKTFAGQGISDPHATIRFDYTPRGFHAQVLTANNKGTYYIDPFAVGNTEYYISYFRKDLNKSRDMQCEMPGSEGLDIPRPNGIEATNAACRGTDLYVYRLAVACTGEYAQAPGIAAGNNPALLHAAIVTTTNRVNGVYEQELAIRLVLIANNTDIEFLDPATDPFNGNNNAGTLINESQTVITNLIGTPNYDIGHTFSTGGGGLAGLGVVCNATNKARGITGLPTPVGDAYDIDFVAHEIGHQFGGSHTFNSQTGNCAGGNRSAASAYEVGSGTTIQAYAGICGADNIQNNSDAVFHPRSFDQISNFVEAGGASCRVLLATGNVLPVATITTPTALSIPPSTPFTLSGTATDANSDALTYCWEQWDLGAASTWNGGNTASPTSPLFKSRIPKVSGDRTFPDIAVIVANYPTNPPATLGGLKGETLPTGPRVMNFRLTVRDNRANGGGVTSVGSGGCQSATPFVVNSVGTTPFTVSVPNGGESYPGGSTQIITWNNALTNAAPFNVDNVKISLSTDGGVTYPTVIIASTPNDGSESVNIPVSTTNTARVKIEAIGNIFFDISNANFVITAPISDFTLSATTPTAITCGTTTTSTTTISSNITGTFASPITLSASGVPAGTTVTFATNPIAAGGSTVATLNNANSLAFGTYNVTITGTGGAITKSLVVTFTVTQGPAIIFTTSPANQTVCTGANATFTAAAPGTVTYQWQVSNNGGTTYTNISGATAASYTVTAATVGMNGNLYRVVATSQCSVGTSSAATLTVNAAPAITSQPTNQTVCAGNTATFTVAATGAGLTYQWQLSTTGCAGVFSNIPGATAASYTTAPVTVVNNGYAYRVIVSGTCAPAATSNCAVLTVGDAAAITSQPQPVTVCSPANATFSVTATGSSLTYQWQVSTAAVPTFTNITGATASTYTTATTPAMNGNQYRVIVFSCTPTGITSNAATLTVNTPASISGQPADRIVCQGESTTFTATATGTGLGYQWQYSATGCAGPFTNIAGATAPSYTIASPTPANNGGYRVIVSGTCGSITSACATLTVNTPIVITAQPQDLGLCVPIANSATFTVAASGTAPTYQWQVSVGSGAFTNIVGATSASYTVTPLAVSQSGNRYRAVVSGTCTPSGVVSNIATLIVNSVVEITNQPSNIIACSESSASFTVVATGSTITYQWQVSVNGGPFSNLTNTAPYSGVNTATLTINPLTEALSGNVYRVVVAGVPCGSVNSNPVTLNVNPKPSVVLSASTVINTTPVLAATSAPGAQVVLAATVSPVGTYTYVWYKDGVVIPVTSASFQLDPNDFGTYYVVVTNFFTGCTQRSNEVTVTPQASNIVFVYPNPNNGSFQVRYFNAGNASIDRTINVYDSKGARVFSRKYTIAPGPFARMDVQLARPTARGMYIVELRDAGGKLVASSRILVN